MFWIRRIISVYSFTHDGEFVDKVACKGNGPEEYTHINDFVTIQYEI